MFNAADSTLALVNPLDTERVLVGPREVDWDDALRVGTSADFDADGVQDFAAWHPDTGTLPREFVIVSGDSLEVLGRLATEDPYTNYLGSVDVDGDGRSEILTQSPAENSSEISAWGFSGGGIDRIASGTIEPPCYPESAVEGDFDGDGLRDLALTWNVGCDVHIGDDPEILIFFAAANSGTSLSPTRAPQPGWAAGVSSVDVDSDGATELIFGVSARNIQVLSWTGESFVQREQLRIPDEYDSSLAEFAAGRLGQEGAPGIFVGTLLASGAPLEDAFIGALFLPPASPQFVPQQGTLVFDLNDDGTDDFSAFRDGEWGQYVSLVGR